MDARHRYDHEVLRPCGIHSASGCSQERGNNILEDRRGAESCGVDEDLSRTRISCRTLRTRSAVVHASLYDVFLTMSIPRLFKGETSEHKGLTSSRL